MAFAPAEDPWARALEAADLRRFSARVFAPAGDAGAAAAALGAARALGAAVPGAFLVFFAPCCTVLLVSVIVVVVFLIVVFVVTFFGACFLIVFVAAGAARALGALFFAVFGVPPPLAVFGIFKRK